MSTFVGHERRIEASSQRRHASPLRLALLALWLLVLATCAVVGERPGSLADLLDAVDSGDVSAVHVAGGLPAGDTGWSIQDVRWRQGLTARHAEVIYASPGYEQETADSNSAAVSVTTTDVTTLIRDRDPNLEVGVSPALMRSTSSVMGWEVPSWLDWVVLIGLVVTLWLIVNGPEPWRATRWGWAWALLFTGPVGAMLFASLAGPTPLVPRAKENARRATGGWTFILMLLLGSLTATLL